MAAPPLTLTDINSAIGTAMVKPEQAVRNMMDALGDGSNFSVAQLTELQYYISVYSLTGNVVSAIMKESSDTMKSVVQKI